MRETSLTSERHAKISWPKKNVSKSSLEQYITSTRLSVPCTGEQNKLVRAIQVFQIGTELKEIYTTVSTPLAFAVMKFSEWNSDLYCSTRKRSLVELYLQNLPHSVLSSLFLLKDHPRTSLFSVPHSFCHSWFCVTRTIRLMSDVGITIISKWPVVFGEQLFWSCIIFIITESIFRYKRSTASIPLCSVCPSIVHFLCSLSLVLYGLSSDINDRLRLLQRLRLLVGRQ